MICHDYDLCEKCEAHPIPFHPPAHHLLKMRTSGVPLPYRPGSVHIQSVPPPSTAQAEATAPVNVPPPPTPSPPPTAAHVPNGPLIPDLNVLVEEPASFPTPTMKPVDVPTIPGLNSLGKESNIPGTFVPDEESFFRNLDLGDLNFERDFGQWFNPTPDTRSDAAIAPQPTPAEPSVTEDVDPVAESQPAPPSPVISEKAIQPTASPTPDQEEST